MFRILPLLTLLLFSCSNSEPRSVEWTCGSIYHHCSLQSGCRLCVICTAVDGPCSQTICNVPDCRDTDYCADIPGAACDLHEGVCTMKPAVSRCHSDTDCGYMSVSRVVPVPTHLQYEYFKCSPRGECVPSSRHCKPTKCYEGELAATCSDDTDCDPSWEFCNTYTGYCAPATCHYGPEQTEEYFTCPIGFHCVPASSPPITCDHEGCTPGHCEPRTPCTNQFDCPDPDRPLCTNGSCTSR